MEIEKSILKVLVYFDIFHYPLTSQEIKSFLDRSVVDKDFTKTIDELVLAKKIFRLDEFYALQNDPSLIERRKKGNEQAAILLMKARQIASRLYKFPYIKAIGVSGSVSKNFADEHADIDYFIITKANRLWIARTLLHLFKKSPFVKNSDRHYCMNYFIDEAELLIEEKNIYTATEVFTLIPVAGNGRMKKFFLANEWSHSYFPNRSLPPVKEDVKRSRSWLKNLAESFLNNKLGDWLDNYFMKLTTKRWKKKEEEQKLNTKGERMGLKTSKHCSKPNPIFFHDWFMSKYERRLEEMEKEWNP